MKTNHRAGDNPPKHTHSREMIKLFKAALVALDKAHRDAWGHGLSREESFAAEKAADARYEATKALICPWGW